MRAFQVTKHADPRDITVSEDVSILTPGKKEVLVEVHAAGVNFFDVLMARGKYQTRPPFPYILGAEFAGRVSPDSPIPPRCPFKPGDRVLGVAQGAYGEYVTVDPAFLVPIPPNLSYEEASVIPLTYTTSYDGIVYRGQAKKGEWVLVHAGAGGVGIAACQIAKVLGCKVIVTASSETKRRVCTERAGVDAAVDYTKADWQKEVMRITGGTGVNVVFDPVGMIMPSLKCVTWNARIVVVGFAAGTIEKIPANLLLLKQASIVGLYWGGNTTKDMPHAIEVFNKVLQLFSSGTVRPIIYEPIYESLESVSRALVDMDERRIWGKGVVRVRPGSKAVNAKL